MTDQARFITESRKKTLCYRFFHDYPERIVKNFDQTGFIITPTTSPITQEQMTPLISVAFVQPPVEVKANSSKADKKLISSGSNGIIKNKSSNLNDQSFIDITQSFSSFLFYFFLPTCAILIITLVFIISKRHFENRIQYRYANPLNA